MANQQKVPEAKANGEDSQWQLNYSTIGDSMGHYFMNENRADVWFVPLLKAASPPKKFPAHKLILESRSPVFYAQFHFEERKKKQSDKNENGGESEEASSVQVEKKRPKMDLPTDSGNNQDETIELSDVEPEAFEQFLRFCYMDKVKISGENAASILHIANRYTVKPLVGLAIKFLVMNTKLENACEMLQFATQFNYEGVKEVEKRALKIIREKTEEVLKTESFLEISSDTLQLIMSQDSLAIKEIALFKALIRWGKNKKKDVENNGKSLREIISPALFHIQFWQMDFWTFGRFVAPTNVLTNEETNYIFKKLSTKTDFFDESYPFTRIENLRGGQFLTLEIENVREFVKGDTPLIENDRVFISGFSFVIGVHPGVKQPEGTRQFIRFYLSCKGVPSDASEKWNCEVAFQLILVAKAPNKKDKIMLFSHRFEDKGDSWDLWARFVSIEDLLDPANGFVDGDGSVTLKAKVQVLERGDFEDAENEIETDDANAELVKKLLKVIN